MNFNFAKGLLKNADQIDPPGCVSTIVEHPNPLQCGKHPVEVGFVMEHRFAFFYWIKCKQELQRGRPSSLVSDDKQFTPPDLVTWDWHDDVGSESDYDEKELVKLNQSDESEVALFCWAGLSPINDGHIAPALWLNALRNVYVVQKQIQNCKDNDYVFKDRFGNEHHVFYFRSMRGFTKTFEKTNSKTGVIWDVDLDYFTKGSSFPDQFMPPMASKDITAVMSPDNPWISLILRDLKAVTIALEPKYTGGLSVSLDLYRQWESALFAVPLFNEKCRWRKGLIKG